MTEDELQKSIVQLLRLHESGGRLRFFHVPNQLPRPSILSAKLGMKMVNMIYSMIDAKLTLLGKRKGIPDLVIVFPDGRTAFWELKVGKNKPTTEQRDWLDWLDRAGCETSVVRDLADAELLLKDYMRRAA